MNLGTHDLKPDSAVAAVLEGDLDDAVDPHLERIKNAVDESDEEVMPLNTLNNTQV